MSCAAPHSAEAATKTASGDLEQQLAPVAVAELAPERRRGRGGDHVGGTTQETSLRLPRSPAIDGQRGGEDRLVENRGQHRQHDRREGKGYRAAFRVGSSYGH